MCVDNHSRQAQLEVKEESRQKVWHTYIRPQTCQDSIGVVIYVNQILFYILDLNFRLFTISLWILSAKLQSGIQGSKWVCFQLLNHFFKKKLKLNQINKSNLRNLGMRWNGALRLESLNYTCQYAWEAPLCYESCIEATVAPVITALHGSHSCFFLSSRGLCCCSIVIKTKALAGKVDALRWGLVAAEARAY